MISKVSYMCGSVLSEYLGTGNDRDERYLKTIFVRENICSSSIELPYYTVDAFPKICIYCGTPGTSRNFGKSVEHYSMCRDCIVTSLTSSAANEKLWPKRIYQRRKRNKINMFDVTFVCSLYVVSTHHYLTLLYHLCN